jgi:hypothetical protein
LCAGLCGFPVIAAGEVFFKPDIEDDEEVAAAHFLDFQFGDAGAAVSPGDGDGGGRSHGGTAGTAI